MTWNDDDLRMISLAAPALLRMLEARRNATLDKIHGEFRAGNTELTPALAELACIRDLIHEVKSAMQTLEAKKGTP